MWSGRDALELGLVDELGGLREAIAAAKELADIPASEKVRLDFYPRAKTFFEVLAEGGQRRRLGVFDEFPEPVRDAMYKAKVWERWSDEPVLALDPLLWGLSVED